MDNLHSGTSGKTHYVSKWDALAWFGCYICASFWT